MTSRCYAVSVGIPTTKRSLPLLVAVPEASGCIILKERTTSGDQGKPLRLLRDCSSSGRGINTLTFFAARHGLLMAGDHDGGVQFWDLRIGPVPQLLLNTPDMKKRPTQVLSLAADVGGDIVVAATNTGRVDFWDIRQLGASSSPSPVTLPLYSLNAREQFFPYAGSTIRCLVQSLVPDPANPRALGFVALLDHAQWVGNLDLCSLAVEHMACQSDVLSGDGGAPGGIADTTQWRGSVRQKGTWLSGGGTFVTGDCFKPLVHAVNMYPLQRMGKLKESRSENAENRQLEADAPVHDYQPSNPTHASSFVACVACHPAVDDAIAGTVALPWESEMLYYSVKPGCCGSLDNNQRDGMLGMYNG
eukprot:evm.model.scf_826.1 EVM.evm.TU.scf_826.1   scf_826:35773-38910(+)